MYFHAPCGIVLHIVVYKLYVNKEKKLSNNFSALPLQTVVLVVVGCRSLLC